MIAASADHLDRLLSIFGRDGQDFERLCKWFLLSDPVWTREIEKVWLWSDWPGRWGRDCGIDLVARRHDGAFVAIQAKNYDRTYTITKRDLDTFLSESARPVIAERLLIASTDRLARAAAAVLIDQDKQVRTVMLADLRAAEVTWPSDLSFGQPDQLPALEPRADQLEALDEIERWAASKESRAQVIRACGTGKTLIAILAADRLRAERVLVLVPTLDLLRQTARAWARSAQIPRRTAWVCSDRTAERDGPARHSQLPARTTDPAKLTALLAEADPLLVLCTYESSPTLAGAMTAAAAEPFDVAVIDEAHRCAGPVASAHRTILQDAALPAKRRLFFTATPAVFGTRDKARAAARNVRLASMDDRELYGRAIHHLSFAEAVRRGLLCPYQVAVIPISDHEVHRLIEERRLVNAGAPDNLEAGALATQIACGRAMTRFGCRRIVAFQPSIEHSKRFAAHLPVALDLLAPDERPIRARWIAHIDGATMPLAKRNERLRRFQAVEPDEIRVLSNVRLLSEGVDVREIDAVAFVGTQRGQAQIIQAVGRAMRPAPAKTVGTVILPVVIREGESFDGALARSEHRGVVDVLGALRSHDPEIVKSLDHLRFDRVTPPPPPPDEHYPPGRFVIDAPVEVGEEFAEAVDLALTTALGDSAQRRAGRGLPARRLEVVVAEPTEDEAFLIGLRELERAGRFRLITRVDHEPSAILAPWWQEVRSRWSGGALSDIERKSIACAASWLSSDLSNAPRQRAEMALLTDAGVEEQILAQLRPHGRYHAGPALADLAASDFEESLISLLRRIKPLLTHAAMSEAASVRPLLRALHQLDPAVGEAAASASWWKSEAVLEAVLDGFEDRLLALLDPVSEQGPSWRCTTEPAAYALGRGVAEPLRALVTYTACFRYDRDIEDVWRRRQDEGDIPPDERLDDLGWEVYLLARRRGSSRAAALDLAMGGVLRRRQDVRADLFRRNMRNLQTG
jgi:superfamily II DNA or RNA helicase